MYQTDAGTVDHRLWNSDLSLIIALELPEAFFLLGEKLDPGIGHRPAVVHYLYHDDRFRNPGNLRQSFDHRHRRGSRDCRSDRGLVQATRVIAGKPPQKKRHANSEQK
jgi:hypothetical protein